MKTPFLLLIPVVLGGCAALFGPDAIAPGSDTVHPVARPGSGAAAPLENARTVEEFDTTSQAERDAATAPENSASGLILGTTIASLGDAAKPGFWLETPLVATLTKGRVVYAATGASVAVDLIPIDGPATGGSRISLAAIRLLGAPLAGLPELIVYAN